MRGLRKFSALLLAAGLAFGLAGCSTSVEDELDQYFDDGFRNNRAGSTTLVNVTNHDMLLFVGEVVIRGNIIGGVRAGDRTNINFSTESDYQVGGFRLVRAVRRSEFEEFGAQSRVDHSAMVTFGEGRRFTTNITSTTDGEFQYVVNNRNRDFGLELRENSPDGQVVAFLTRGEVRRVIQTSSSNPLTLFPVWVGFNRQTSSIVTFAPTGPLDAQNIQPMRVTDDPSPLYFPAGGTTLIDFPIELPFATVRVQNNVVGMMMTFRNAGTNLRAESGFVGINSGRWESFEIRPPSPGATLNLNVVYGAASAFEVPVRFYGQNTLPVIGTGYFYVIEVNAHGPLDDAANVSATLRRQGPIDTSQLVVGH
ncbi:MAG: hypothetical protein FWB79_01315 [Treponema sp.]|nr:hypothetical protein [Treponema sp.]